MDIKKKEERSIIKVRGNGQPFINIKKQKQNKINLSSQELLEGNKTTISLQNPVVLPLPYLRPRKLEEREKAKSRTKQSCTWNEEMVGHKGENWRKRS